MKGVKLETRERIMEQMLIHVHRYGRKRTRLVSLAEDLDMSHANIYRHFKNKTEILDAVVIDWLRSADSLIDEAAAKEQSAAGICTAIVIALHRFLKWKLENEPGAIEVFRHAFSDQPKAVANHLTGLRLKIGTCVAEHGEKAGEASEKIALRLDLLTTVLESFLNPVQIFERGSENDEEQLRLLMALFFAD
ncbi:MAG: TetR/AcrR family transcriptional regulator [Parasphingorhabdus sp.]|uniref:TetR/AcrR family transcriptional regulator n=1 Tax=Parasphingorhabdus sp. TaxID=2709688 RepID=UPI003299F531